MIHAYKIHGENIVLDVMSGAVHLLDDTAYDVLGCYNSDGTLDPDKLRELTKYDEKTINEALKDIEYLIENKMLFTEDPYTEMLPVWTKQTVVKALCLHIAHDCNLRCSYCFAGTGEYMGHRSLMSLEVGKKAIDFLIENSGNRRNLEVDFFGGEPLMNFDVVKGIVDYAKEREKESDKNFRFTITTNAMLLDDEKRAYINENMHNVVLSLDGRKEVNDAVRKRVDGTGSYDRILPLTKKMVEERGGQQYYVRGTFTRKNLDFGADVLHLADLGFDQISIEPVVAAKDSGLDIRNEDLETVFSEYERLAKEYVDRRNNGKWFNFFHFMIDLEGGPCIAKRMRGCGSGTEYLAVSPEGELYPCHQFVGHKEFYLGNIFDGLNGNPIRETFRETNVYTKPQCDSCWAKFYCSGGCAANAWQFNHDIKVPYEIGCELEKKRVECALWIKAQEISESQM
ncbi:MAG: thioether cross-link-forming SCIFF peptide maturase [Clostridiaceae bacterium]|nr:thioether cross-link-forming SCIFF peptide maturase [Clostridiaceae bacterium]